MAKDCVLYFIDDDGEKRCLQYTPFVHFNLMELVEDKIYIEWGDCKGRAMCGTCHVKVLDGQFEEPNEEERNTLEGLPNHTERSRLACQIYTDESLNNMTFQILRDY